MKISTAFCFAVVMSFSAPRIASAADQPKDVSKPAVVEAEVVHYTGTVESIDYTTRMMTLKGTDGQTVSMEVGPEAVRFNDVKKGDQVKIDYLESVAVMVQSPSDTISSAESSGSVIIRNKGQKPSGTKVETEIVTATVEKINAKKRTAVLKGPDGKTFPIDIAPDVKNLENVKKGDQLVIKRTRTVAIDVSKPGK